jgi:hypothetical protein
VLAQRCDTLVPCIRARLLRDSDAPAVLAHLLAAKPWSRTLPRGARAVPQSFVDGAWTDDAPGAQADLHAAEAQAWLALVALLSDGGRDSGAYAPHARSRVLTSARRALTSRVLDALPALVWLARAAAEQADAPAHDALAAGGVLLLQSLPPWRDRLLSDTNWQAVAAAAVAGVFGNTPEATAAASREATAAAALWDQALVLRGAADETRAARQKRVADDAPVPPPSVQLEFACRHGDAWVHACSVTLLPDVAAPATAVSLCDGAGAAVKGHRWRLLPPHAPRRLPPRARVRCQLGVVDALLDLPAPAAARGAAADEAWRAAPHVLWVTLGSLARDGFAVQLRLARVDAPGAAGIDGNTGALTLYRAAGGAVTLLTPHAL